MKSATKILFSIILATGLVGSSSTSSLGAGDPTSLTLPQTPAMSGPVAAGASAAGGFGPTNAAPSNLLKGSIGITEDQALNAALLAGPRAAWMRSQLGVSKAAIKQAWVLPNPALEFDNGYAEFSYRVGIAIPLEPPWKVFLRVNAAKENVGVTQLQLEQSLWNLRADTRRAYTELVIAEEAVVMMRDLAHLTRVLADAAAKKFSVGDVAKLDSFKAELAYQQADIEASQAERRVIQAREQLNIIMGRGEASDLAIPKYSMFTTSDSVHMELLPDLSKPMPPLAQYIESGINDRLETKIIRQEIVATKAGRKLAKGNIVPTGQMAFGYDRQVNALPEPNYNRLYLMGSFPIPVFDRQQGEIARLNATLTQLNMELSSQQNIIRGQIALAYRKVLNARENIRKYQASVLSQSDKVASLGRLSYKLGQTDITSALNAQQSNIQVRNQYLNEVLNYQLAFTELEQATGRMLQ